MTWFKVDDSLHSHPKATSASLAALGLWAVAGSWSGNHLTDGFLPDHVILQLSRGSSELADELVVAGLWKRSKGGYRFHQWHTDGDGSKRNPTRKEVEADREAARARMRRIRAGQNPNGSGDVRPNNKRSSPEVRDPRPEPEVAKATSGGPRKRGTRIPAGFVVSEAMVEWAREKAPGIDGRRETDKFVNYWQGESGKNAEKLDWVAAWRTWMLRAEPARNGHRDRTVEQVAENWTPPTPPDEVIDDPDAYRAWHAGQLANHRKERT